MSFDPNASINNLKGVGPRLAATLAKLGIFRFVDLLLHLPFRYQDRTQITPLNQIRAGDECLIQGQVINCAIQFGRRRSLRVTVEDDSGQVQLRFFHFSKFQQAALDKAQYIRAYGEFRFFGRELSAAHPEYEIFDSPPSLPTPTLTPIYPTTQGLGQGRLRNFVSTLCAYPWPDVAGTPFAQLKFLHQPPAGTSLEDISAAQEQIALDELTAYYVVMKGRALKRQQEHARA